MLLGCCHCGEESSESIPPSESTPPSESESVSESDFASESVSESSIETITSTCIMNIGCPAVPRYLRWSLGPGAAPFACLDSFYVGDFKLELCSCQYVGTNNWTLVYVTTTRAKAVYVSPGVCTGDDNYTGPVGCTDYASAASMRYYAIIYRIPANAFAKVTVRAQAANAPDPSSPFNFHWGSAANLFGQETYDPCMFTPVTLTQQVLGFGPIGAATGVLSPW
jgi:hypothetical protein